MPRVELLLMAATKPFGLLRVNEFLPGIPVFSYPFPVVF
jgi:hypothetical protein